MAESVEPLPKVALSSGCGGRYPRRGHYVRNSLIGIFSFVVFCLTIHSLLPLPEISRVGPKLRYLRDHKSEFDTVFIGSSRIYRGIVPQTFDRVTAEASVATHSFNLAVGGMQPPESLYFLDQVLNIQPPNLRWVFVELEEVQAQWARDRTHTHRFYYWHNWRFTRAAMESAIDPNRPRTWWNPRLWWSVLRSTTVRVHLFGLLKNMANVGAKDDFFPLFNGQFRSNETNDEFDITRGFEPDPRKEMTHERTEAYLKDVERRKRSAHSRPLDVVSDEVFREAGASISAIGASPIYLIAPGENQTGLQFRDGPAPGPVLAFNNANQYPAFYDLAFRADEQHLKSGGAEIFTRRLAERFVAEVANASRNHRDSVTP